MPRPGGYIDVDQLQAETTLDSAAAKCGIPLDVHGTGPEVRIDCPFGCRGDHCGRREIAINTENPQKVFQCHAYQCGFRGNLLTLMHGFLTGAKPTGGKLKGDEFQRVKRLLAGDATHSTSTVVTPSTGDVLTEAEGATPSGAPSKTPPLRVNLPLIDSPDPRVRELHNLDDKLIRDVAAMNPAAAAYVRRHPCLTPESMAKWRCGYLPHDGGGDKRGWSLRGHILYPVLSEAGQVLAWVGRDVQYEAKELAFRQLTPEERTGREPPAKHRFPKGFHRGEELFGQHAARLKEPGYREFIREHGLVLVEGFNDVIQLDTLGVPALAILSNRMTDAQGEKLVRFANQLAAPYINLMFDRDDAGTAGAKDAMWWFASRRVDSRVDSRLVWTDSTTEGRHDCQQPESVTLPQMERFLWGASAVRD